MILIEVEKYFETNLIRKHVAYKITFTTCIRHMFDRYIRLKSNEVLIQGTKKPKVVRSLSHEMFTRNQENTQTLMDFTVALT